MLKDYLNGHKPRKEERRYKLLVGIRKENGCH